MLSSINYLETERMKLKLVDDVLYNQVINSYSDEEIANFFGHASLEETEKEKFRAKGGIRTFNKTILLFYLTDKSTHQVFGWCGYHTWYLDHRRAELGYTLFLDEYKNKGYMGEALKAVIPYGFHEMNLNRIEAMVSQANIPSLKLLENSGFKKEGHLREHYCVQGIPEDSLIYSLLKSEWNPEKRKED